MYDLPYHKERNEETIRAFIDEHPFAFLTGRGPDGRPVATQVPMLLEERDGRTVLFGHIMKSTDHHEAFAQNKEVLVVFTGRHVYVSGTWYSEPHTPSTWNYMSVHARGIIRFLGDDGLQETLRKTSLRFEGDDPRSPTVFDNLPPDFRETAMRLIVAFEIEVTGMDTVFKLSQDRDPKSYRNIIKKLETQGEDGRVIAAEMEKREREVFPADGAA
ncbi:MAG: FMN-binding negative transcriptional regulator [Euryarchaeota archaeon]|nr:FMN-binding negative transcriptional regulator [Euryarchaeota archaeon]